jgi:hypothetical protein
MHRCVECSRPGNAEVLVQYGEIFVCMDCKEAFLDKLKQGAPIGRPLPGSGLGPWRLGKDIIVFERGAPFPDLCLNCGKPADYFLSQTLESPMLTRLFQRGMGPVTVTLPCCRQHSNQIKKTKSACLTATVLCIAVVTFIALYLSGLTHEDC